MKRRWTAAFGLLLLTAVACGDSGETPGLGVVSQTPSFETKVIRTTDPVRVVFEETLDTASVTAESFRILDTVSGRAVPGSLSVAKTNLEGDTVVFVPRDPWVWGRRYRLSLSRDIRGAATGLRYKGALPFGGLFVANIPNDFDLPAYDPLNPFEQFTATAPLIGFDPLAPESDAPPWRIPGLNATGAWKYSIGRPDVVMAVVDNGMQDYGEPELRRQFFLNRGELPLPRANGVACGDYDCNGDGRFDADDYAGDDRLPPSSRPRNAMDLITAFSDGRDDDGNGLPDDISGWDFLRWVNTALGDRRLPEGVHGQGRAELAAAQGDNGEGRAPGICSECRILPLRTTAGLLHEYSRMAAAFRYATRMGASVVSVAGVHFTYSAAGHEAVEEAHRAGALTVAATGDELTFHHWMPAAGEDVFAAKSLFALPPLDLFGQIRFEDFGFLEGFCTNYGPHTLVALPTATGCSSDAVGLGVGAVGLIVSRGRELGIDLAADEVRQILASTAYDIRDHCFSLSEFGNICQEGYDEHFAYGRPDLELALRTLGDPDLGIEAAIPPSVRITSPRWWETFDPSRSPTLSIEGEIRSRVAPYDWTVEIAEGHEPLDAEFQPVASGRARSDLEGLLAEARLADYFPEAWASRVADGTHAFDVTVRVRASYEARGVGTVRGEARKDVSVHTDADPGTGLVPGFPIEIGDSGESSPVLYDLDGDPDGGLEIVFGTGGGWLQALELDPASGLWRSMAGFPVDLRGANTWVADSIFASVAVGDLFGDGTPRIVAATMGGLVYVVDPGLASSGGAVLPGFPVSADAPDNSSAFAYAFGNGFLASPVLVDLDRDGVLEIVAVAQDSKAYAWKPLPGGGGVARLAGWPVVCRSLPGHVPEDKVCSETDYPTPITGTPAAGILDPASADPHIRDYPSVVVATNEACEGGTSRVYAIFHDGEAHAGGPFLPGWPARPASPIGGFIPLAYITGAVSSPAVAVTSTGAHIGVGTAVWLPQLIDYAAGQVTSKGIPAGPALNTMASPAFTSLEGDGRLQYVLPMTGALRQEEESVVLLNSRVVAFDLDPPHTMRLQGLVNGVPMLVAAAVADVNGDGRREAIAGTGGYLVHALSLTGTEAGGWPKYTQKWTIATPAAGDIDADGKIEIVATTREGWLYAWESEGAACPGGRPNSDWPRFHHDERNTGFHGADTVPPARVTDLVARRVGADEVALEFTAPGDDWRCGSAAAYEVRGSLDAGAPLIAGSPRPKTAGSRESFVLSAPGASNIVVQARDEAGNLSRASGAAEVPP